MPTLEQVKEQLSKVDGISHLLARKEIKELPAILWEDEHVNHMLQGTYNNGVGALFATNKRLIFVDKGLIFGLKVEDFPYDKVTSIQYETGMLLGSLTIFASGNRADIKNCDKKLVRSFGEYVRARTGAAPEAKSASVPPAQGSVLDQLERLGKLKADGVLTETEFQQQKSRLLA